MLQRWFLGWVVLAVAVWVTVAVFPGIEADWRAALGVGVDHGGHDR